MTQNPMIFVKTNFMEMFHVLFHVMINGSRVWVESIILVLEGDLRIHSNSLNIY